MQQAFDPAMDHSLSREEAAKLVGAFQQAAGKGEHLSTAFNRSAFEKLLGQAGCAGIRIYRALHADATPTLVVVGVDATGKDLAGAESVFIQNGTNCPPFCEPMTWV